MTALQRVSLANSSPGDAGSDPEIETVEEYTGLEGRKKIVRLRAALQYGTGILLQFVPHEDGQPQNCLTHWPLGPGDSSRVGHASAITIFGDLAPLLRALRA